MGWRRELTYRGLLVDGFDDELLVVEGDVPDLAPGEANLWGQSGGASGKMRST